MCYVVGRFWHDKLQRPFWYHRAEGGTWRSVERTRRTVCRNLCMRTFRHWESLWAYTFMADMCFEYADYGSDGTGD